MVFMERCQTFNIVFVFYFPEFFKANTTDGSQSAALRTQDAPAALALL